MIKSSSPFWMSELGVQRSFFTKIICQTCGERQTKRYLTPGLKLPPPHNRGQWYLSDCLCIKKAREESRRRQERLAINNRLDPLPPALRGQSFENFQVTEFNKEPKRICGEFVRNFSKVKVGQGLLLFGPSGTGKTHLASAIANSLKDQYEVGFYHTPTLLQRLRFNNLDLGPLLTADLLILDDLGSERETGWTMERLLIIVDGRLNHFKPTVFTTNFDPNDLEKRVGMRVASRIIGNNLPLVLHGPDWRLKRHGL